MLKYMQTGVYRTMEHFWEKVLCFKMLKMLDLALYLFSNMSWTAWPFELRLLCAILRYNICVTVRSCNGQISLEQTTVL